MTVEKIKDIILSYQKEMEEYMVDEDYNDLEQHDARIARDAYAGLLSYIKSEEAKEMST